MTSTVLAKPLAPQPAATASFAAVAGRIYPINATASDITATLPQNVRQGAVLVFTRSDSTTHVVTISRGGADTISSGTGTTTALTLGVAGDAVTLVSDGAGHWTVTHRSSGGAASPTAATIVNATGTADSAAILAAFNSMKVNGHATGTLIIKGAAAIDTALVLDGGYTVGFTQTGGAGEQFTLIAEKLVSAQHIGAALTVKGFHHAKLDLSWFGGGHRRVVTDAAMTASSTTLTSATAAFASRDVGKFVRVEGASFLGEAPLCARIASVTNSTTAVLDIPAQHTVSGATCAIEDIALTMQTIVNCEVTNYAMQFAGLALHVDDIDIDHAPQQVTFPNVAAQGCGQAMFVRCGNGDFGQFLNVWDSNSTDGTVFAGCSDLTVNYFESGGGNQTSAVLVDSCYGCHWGTFNLGWSGSQGMLKVVNGNGGDGGHWKEIYLTGSGPNSVQPDGLVVVDGANYVPMIVNLLTTNNLTKAFRARGGNVIIEQYISQTADVNPIYIEAGPTNTAPVVVIKRVDANYFGKELAVIASSCAAGTEVSIAGRAVSSNRLGTATYLVDCQSTTAILDVRELRDLNQGGVTESVHHATIGNLLLAPQSYAFLKQPSSRTYNMYFDGIPAGFANPLVSGTTYTNTGKRPLRLVYRFELYASSSVDATVDFQLAGPDGAMHDLGTVLKQPKGSITGFTTYWQLPFSVEVPPGWSIVFTLNSSLGNLQQVMWWYA